MLPVGCCMLHVACCTLPVARCLLHVARCLLHVACCMLHAACCMLSAARCTLPVACCTLHVACLSGEPMARRLLVEARLRSRTDQGAHSPLQLACTTQPPLPQTPQCWRIVRATSAAPSPRFGFPLKPQTCGFGPRALIHSCRAAPCRAVLCRATQFRAVRRTVSPIAECCDPL